MRVVRNKLEISTSKLIANFVKIKEFVAPLNVMPVLKANAYGLGMQKTLSTLAPLGLSIVGVADINEAIQAKSFDADVLILGDLLYDEIELAINNDIICPLTSYQQACSIDEIARSKGKIVRGHVLIDTGMGRLGIPCDKAIEEISLITQLKNIELDGLYSHFPFAYEDVDFSNKQVAAFIAIHEKLKSRGISFKWIHIANSDGINNIKSSIKEPFNLVRTGINLYGCYDLKGEHKLNLEQVFTLKSSLVAIRDMKAGETLGYGREKTLERDSRIGVVAIGYADGLPIQLSNKGYLKIAGHKTPVIGRVSMDYTTVDLTDFPEINLEDEVICLGDGISVDEWADLKNSIPYEIICSLSYRVQREYI